jgi:hypothetical protein
VSLSDSRLIPHLFCAWVFPDPTFPYVLGCCSQELEGQARARYDRLTQLSTKLDWYRGQYDTLYALVEALRTDNDWLEYWQRSVRDARLD